MLRKGTSQYNKERFSPKTKRGASNFFDVVYRRYERPFSEKAEYVLENDKLFVLETGYEYLSTNAIISCFGYGKLESLRKDREDYMVFRFSAYPRIIKSHKAESVISQNLNFLKTKGKILFEFLYDNSRYSFSIPLIEGFSFVEERCKSENVRRDLSRGSIKSLLGIGLFENTIKRNVLEAFIEKSKFEHMYGVVSYADFMSRATFLSAKLDDNTLSYITESIESITEWPIEGKKNKKFFKRASELLGNLNIEQGKVYLGKDLNEMLGKLSLKNINLEHRAPTPPRWYRKEMNSRFKTEEKEMLQSFLKGKTDVVCRVGKKNASWYW